MGGNRKDGKGKRSFNADVTLLDNSAVAVAVGVNSRLEGRRARPHGGAPWVIRVWRVSGWASTSRKSAEIFSTIVAVVPAGASIPIWEATALPLSNIVKWCAPSLRATARRLMSRCCCTFAHRCGLWMRFSNVTQPTLLRSSRTKVVLENTRGSCLHREINGL